MSDQELISKTYKEFLQLNIKKIPSDNLIKNGQRTRIDISPKKTYIWLTGK